METAPSRCAFAVRSDRGKYAGIALLKVGEGSDGSTKNGLKVSTFKMAAYAEGQGVADLLISLVFSDVNRLAYDLLADEYRSRSDSGPNPESAEYLAGVLNTGLTPVYRLGAGTRSRRHLIKPNGSC